MAKIKWSAFPAGTTIDGADSVVGEQSGVNVIWTWSQVLTYIAGGGANFLVGNLQLGATDTNLSRISAGVVGVGTGAQGSVAGTLSLGNLTVANNGAINSPGTIYCQPTGNFFVGGGGGVFWSFNASGHFVALFDNQNDIGASGATRPRNAYLAGKLSLNGTATIFGVSTGNIKLTNNNETDFGQLMFGGENSSYPAIVKNGTSLEIKLADGSAYTTLKAGIVNAGTAPSGIQAGDMSAARTSVNGALFLGSDASSYIFRQGGVSVALVTNGDPFVVPAVVNVASGTATPAHGSTSAVLLFGTTAGFGIYYGSNTPTVSAAQGSLYLRSDGSSTSTRAYINTDGGTTWTAITTAG